MKHVKLLGSAAAAVLVFAFAGCAGPATAPDPGATPGADYAPMRVGVGADAAYAPFFIADQNDLFAKVGLEVELVPFANGGDALNALGAGQIQVTMSSPATITSTIANNPEITAFAEVLDVGRYNKVVLRNGIESAADVKNFGYVAGLSHYLSHAYFESNGVDPDSINWIAAGAADLPALIQRGDIDGFFLWQPWPTNIEKAGTGHVVAVANDIPGLKLANWLATTHDWFDDNEKTAAAFVSVVAQAIEVIDDDPDAAAAAVEKAVAIEAADARVMLDEMDFQLTAITPEAVEATTKVGDFFVENGTITATPDLATSLIVDWSWN